MLLLDLVDDNSFRSRAFYGVEQNIGGNCDEEQSVEKNEQYEETIYPSSDSDCHQLIIWIGIKCG